MHRARQDSRPNHTISPSVESHPFLNIHSASLAGNFGLVAYALSSGISPTCTLDGVTPLHAACASQQSSNDAIVTHLIQCGADVNAPRGGSRRGSTEARATKVGGGAGYTALHFIASAGHSSLLPILLTAGADPTIPDRHGALPHHIAQQCGHTDIEAALLDAIKDRATTSTSATRTTPPTLPRGLLAKRSIDNGVLERRIASSPSSYYSPLQQSPPALETANPIPVHESSSGRRPSLAAHVVDYIHHHGHANTTPPPKVKKERRPRSAGSTASETSVPSPTHQSGIARKLGTKYSLLNILKKPHEEEDPFAKGTTTSSPQSAFFNISPTSHKQHRTGPAMMASSPPKSESNSPPRTVGASGPGTSPTMPRPGILRSQHGRTTSANSTSTSGQVSRKSSSRTLRFEDSVADAPPLPVRRTSDASEPELVSPKWRSDTSGRDTVEGDDKGPSLQMLAVANSNRARGNSDPINVITTVVSSAIDVPKPLSRTSPPRSASSVSSSPGGMIVVDAGSEEIDSDPDVPEYCSDLSDEDDQDQDRSSARGEPIDFEDDNVQYAVYNEEVGDNDTKPTLWSSPSLGGVLSPAGQYYVRSHQDAKSLVEQIQRDVLEHAENGVGNLSEQLAAYGETLAIERRFAKGERQRHQTQIGLGIVSVDAGSGDLAALAEDEEQDTRAVDQRIEQRAKSYERQKARLKRDMNLRKERSDRQLSQTLKRSLSLTSAGLRSRPVSTSGSITRSADGSVGSTGDASDSSPLTKSTPLPSDQPNATERPPLAIDIVKTMPTPTDSPIQPQPSPRRASPPKPISTHGSRRPSNGGSVSPARGGTGSSPARRRFSGIQDEEVVSRIAAAPLPSADSMILPRPIGRAALIATQSSRSSPPSPYASSTSPKASSYRGPRPPSPDVLPARTRDREAPFLNARNAASTPKLARLGFDSDPFTVSEKDKDLANAHTAKTDKKRFGFKSIVQTIKGRS